jgi:hypothetical protein
MDEQGPDLGFRPPRHLLFSGVHQPPVGQEQIAEVMDAGPVTNPGRPIQQREIQCHGNESGRHCLLHISYQRADPLFYGPTVTNRNTLRGEHPRYKPMPLGRSRSTRQVLLMASGGIAIRQAIFSSPASRKNARQPKEKLYCARNCHRIVTLPPCGTDREWI